MIGTAFYVMDYVEGRLFWDAALPEVERRRAPRDLRGNDPRARRTCTRWIMPPWDLSDYGKPGHYVERQVARWTQQYRASETETIDAMERLIEWLPQAHSRR